LNDIAHALEQMDGAAPEVAAYCSRLNKLVGAVLVSASPASEPEKDAPAPGPETARRSVRPGMRRR
jgi:hypothetical protein